MIYPLNMEAMIQHGTRYELVRYCLNLGKIVFKAITAISFMLITANKGIYAFEFSGFSDTSAYTYSTLNKELEETETNYRFYESILFDLKLNDILSFYTNDRIIYRGLEKGKDENEDPEKVDLNMYAGYFDFKMSDKLNFQAGRIMDINNLAYSFFDGINAKYKREISGMWLEFSLYGGLLVNDDYLEDDDKVYGYNSYDVRNFYFDQRKGDYIGGAKADLFSGKIGAFTLDYQQTMNDTSLAEQYISLDFDTMFSKLVKLYGFGTYDIIEKLPSNTLAGVRVNPMNLVSFALEHEYYRPVYIKDSFFWEYFKPYGHQAVSGTILFFFSPVVTLDAKYSRLFYEGTGEQGDEGIVTLENRDLLGIGIALTSIYLSGPEGDKITGIGMLKRRFFNLMDISMGGGVVYYEEDDSINSFAELKKSNKAYVARTGLGIKLFNRIIISGDAEYFNNPKYLYDIRALFSVRVLF